LAVSWFSDLVGRGDVPAAGVCSAQLTTFLATACSSAPINAAVDSTHGTSFGTS
jgi:hypothetical protein